MPVPTFRFTDRRAAGRELGERLRRLSLDAPIVLGLARGGVPVAHEVARALTAPLDVLVVRKIGAPGNPELGVGAVAEGGLRVLDRGAITALAIHDDELGTAINRATAQVQARVTRYRAAHDPMAIEARTTIVVDDGLATGATARAALRQVRRRRPSRLVLAVPVGAAETVASLRREADEVICLCEPAHLGAVGLWYEHFEPTSDDEVAFLLGGDSPGRRGDGYVTRETTIPGAGIRGDLTFPPQPEGLILFAHGSASNRFSPRNRQVARALNEHGLATLLLDLLRPPEAHYQASGFDIGLLTARLVATTRWVETEPELALLPIGYFGASTGAAAALGAAAELGDEVGAVVSRGGRPDLAGSVLPDVRAPVLLIVGGRDELVLELNREASRHLRAPWELAVVPGATHLFEEAGALESVAELAGAWFARHLTPRAVPV